jgi:hypothetical protein
MMLKAAVVLAFFTASALAGESLDIGTFAGVYKHRFVNSDVTGQKFLGEDILEIVKLSPREAYFRIHLDFFNGHMCALYGVAKIEANVLVYRSSGTVHRNCVFKMTVGAKSIVFTDVGGYCRADSCGSRGGYDNTRFELNIRRPIRYMKRLKASREYAEALEDAGLNLGKHR